MSNLDVCKLDMHSNALLMLHNSAYSQLCNTHHAKCHSHKGLSGSSALSMNWLQHRHCDSCSA